LTKKLLDVPVHPFLEHDVITDQLSVSPSKKFVGQILITLNLPNLFDVSTLPRVGFLGHLLLETHFDQLEVHVLRVGVFEVVEVLTVTIL
jgi:hypothetical protein